jgi:uncharacterized protein (TIGR02270 family)
MHNLKGLRNPIPEIIKRHAGDAAFYWNQWDKAKYSFVIDGERLAHIEHLLIAHLDGLIEANDIGWQESLANLKRWKGAGETFVCCLLAMTNDSQERFKAIWPTLGLNSADCARGFISALIWYHQRTATPTRWLDHWLQSAESQLLKTVAIRASTHLGFTPIELLTEASQSESPHLRASACRALTLHKNDQFAFAILHNLLNDSVATVKAEASIGLLTCTHDKQVIYTATAQLWDLIIQHLSSLNSLKGSKQRAALRQLKRWLFHWAAHTPLSDKQLATELEQLPPTLQIEAIGWHGDASLCTQLLALMENLELAPAALAQFQLLTGCDAEAEHLILPVTPEQLIAAERLLPEYQGMPFPNLAAIRAWWSTHQHRYSASTKVLLGHAIQQNESTQDFLASLNIHAVQRIKQLSHFHAKKLSIAI